MNIVDVSYSLETQIAEDFQGSDKSFNLSNFYSQSGVGMNLKLGAIYLPTNHLRLGFALHTPTVFTVSETTDVDLKSMNINPEGKDVVYLPEKGFLQEYQLISPTQLQLSTAYLFGNRGLISAEYNFINYPGMKFSYNGSSNDYDDESSLIKDTYENTHVIKVGGEFKVNPQVALRAGYAHYTSPFNAEYERGKSLGLNTANTNTTYINQFAKNYISAGIGYRTNAWYFDFAYTLKLANEDFYPYQSLTKMPNGNLKTTLVPAGIEINNHQLAFTVGLRM